MAESHGQRYNSTMLEVVEALLKMCVDREKQITDLNRLVEGLQHKLSRKDSEKNCPNVGGAPPAEGGHGIVIVGISPSLQQKLSLLLEQNGFDIVGATSEYKQATNLVKTLKPNLIMIDFKLPNMEGLMMSQKIKRDFPGTKIIIMSEQLEEQIILRAIQYGADEYIAKPISPVRLLQVLETLMPSKKTG